MAIACHSCSAELRDGARFCDACGSPVVVTDSHAEYKQVTVLFADVVHSMDIAAAVGAERLREIMAELLNRSSRTVQRYGGTVDKFTGDGVMAVFGAPIAFEDHALRACRAALDVQKDAKGLAAEVERRDNITLQLRVGLNSGEVITGDVGSGPLAYTAVGEQVGMAQRMESIAAPGAVMVSESTARLVENSAILGEPELVHVKGAQLPVPARRLLGVATGRRTDRVEATLVGRDWELGALRGLLERAMGGNGSVVGLVGPPGIGKSRLVHEITSRAIEAEAEVFTAHCESHTADVPFHAAASLLRATTSSNDMDAAAARQQIRARFSGAEDEDLLILEDLLGIGDPAAELAQIDPDARRRRLTAMVNAAALARSTPTVYVIEDAHWIDEISESMLADFLSVVPRTRSLVLITYRPEYGGALAHAPRAQTFALEPLDDSQMSQLSAQLLGEDRSVAEVVDLVADRAGGNPFFAEEIIRDLKERDVLIGGRGCYLCVEPARDVSVPSTLQAVVAARIDRLAPAAKRTLNAAAVVGSQFGPETLKGLDIEPVLDDLVHAELIDQTVFGPQPRYAFRHGLVRAVAYESQLKSDRAQLHRRLADSLERHDQNASLIAEHLEAAGDLREAYEWHMRAGTWLTNRDHMAAQMSWERAINASDALSADFPDRLAMQIAPRTMLCSNAFRRFHPDLSGRFEELRQLCMEAGDKASLAIGMAGMTMEHMLQGRVSDASRQASEHMALVESVGDDTLTLALSFPACSVKIQAVEMADVLRWAQTAIDIADGDPSRGNFMLGSPLAIALVFRGFARCTMGHSGWRKDLDDGVAMARTSDPATFAVAAAYKYVGIGRLVLSADAAALAEITEAFEAGQRCSEDLPLILLQLILGGALTFGEDHARGLAILTRLRDTCVKERYAMNIVSGVEMILARHAATENIDSAIERARAALEKLFEEGNFINCDTGTHTLVELLSTRKTSNDLKEAEVVIGRLSATLPDAEWITRDIVLLRMRALLAQARGDDASYRDFRDRYRGMADHLGFEGHMALAAAMP